jgi:type VI secretion system protein ImpC
MKRESNFGEINLDVSVGREPRRNVPHDDTPFRIALIGDFSGRPLSDRRADLGALQPIAIDRDNFDEVLAKIGPKVRLPSEGNAAAEILTFSELDDFHPDRLLQRSAMFRKLRDLRERLQDPRSVASVLEELGIGQSAQSRVAMETDAERRTTASVQAASLASGGLLDDAIAQTESQGGEENIRRKDELREFAQRAAAPYTVPAADPRQMEVLALIERALSLQMRSLLHFPPLQTLEAAWRAVFLLVRRVPTGPQLKLYLLDVSQEELAADLRSSSDLRQCGAYRLLVEKSLGTPGAEPWALQVGNFVFGPRREDAELLDRIARIARAAGAIFLAEASPALLGCESLAATPDSRNWEEAFPDDGAAAAWKSLRTAAEAAHAGLALPRLLLRLPYGKDTDPIDAFPFEEMPDAHTHEHYLWGNPAFPCALLLAQSFGEEGWQMRPASHLEIDRLPLHVIKVNGESKTQPCAEALITEHTAESILDKGFIPLASMKDQDTVRVVRFQSIADPLQSLAGPWAIRGD